MNPKLIACRAMIHEMRPFLPQTVETEVFEISLHTRPQVLHDALQRAIAAADGNFDPILLGYGLCAQAVVGLVAKGSRIVVPKRHDCIGVFLGSEQARRDQIAVEPGTLYLTHGYIEGFRCEKEGPVGEYSRMVTRYGKERAVALSKRMMRHYKRLVYLRNAYPEDLQGDRKYAQDIAKRFALKYEERDGDSSLLRRLTAFDWKHDFVVAQPGHKITLEDFM